MQNYWEQLTRLRDIERARVRAKRQPLADALRRAVEAAEHELSRLQERRREIQAEANASARGAADSSDGGSARDAEGAGTAPSRRRTRAA